jgi:glucose/mannose-6-phosphate isomerase
MMDVLIQGFGKQLTEALEIGKNAKLTAHHTSIHNVLVTGLGGSGMGANVVIDVLGNSLQVPMMVNKDYHLPAFVNEHTLVIASSYSGNTEETVTALNEAIAKKAKVVCVSTGGKLGEIASANQLDFITLPAGRPPRASLGYSFVQQFFILHFFGLTNNSFIADIEQTVQLLATEDEAIKQQAQELAQKLYNKLPIVYAPEGYGAVAVRWRQQFNENAKMLCWHHVIPEMNHNELVGWRTADEQWAPIFMHATDIEPRSEYRMQINKEILSKYASTIIDVQAKGATRIQRQMYLNYLGDWTSWYMAQLRGFDATEVVVIDYLKDALSKI